MFFPSFLGFTLLIITLLLFNTHLSLPPEMCNSRDQAAQYHIRDFYVGGFISVPALVCLRSQKCYHLIHAGFLRGLFFAPEDGGDMFL
jgi:hypothetical protein